MISTHTITLLSGTFFIPTWLAHNPKMLKEPSIPSLVNAQTDRPGSKIESDGFKNNNGQHTIE